MALHSVSMDILGKQHVMSGAAGIGKWPPADAPAAGAALHVRAGFRVRRRHAAHCGAGQPRGPLSRGPPRQPPPYTLRGQARPGLAQGLGRLSNRRLSISDSIQKSQTTTIS